MTEVQVPGKYRLPADWERQEAVWFAWPSNKNLWSGCLKDVQAQMAQLFCMAADFQQVCVLCPRAEQ